MSHRRQERQRAPTPHRFGLAVALCAGMLLAAAPAWAARIVGVRVGQHEGYSRVVFELDSPVGYKVERSTPSPGVSELIVSLDAAARPQALKGRLTYIDSVQVHPEGSDRATARIRLKGSDLKLKEMILANPPRIVLDVLNEKAMAAAPSKKTAAKAPAKTVTKTVAKAPADSAAKTDTHAMARVVAPQPPASMPEGAAASKVGARRAPAARPAPAPERPAKTTVSPPKPTAATPPKPPPATLVKPPAVTPRPVAPAATPAPHPAAIPAPAPAAMPAPHPAAVPEPQAAAVPSPPGTAGQPPTAVPPADARPRPVPAATARPKPTPPRPAAATPAGKGLLSLQNIAVGAVGLLLVVGAGVVFVRRRRAVEVVDASAFENPLGDENPFAGLDGGSEVEVEAETEEVPIGEAAHAEAGIPVDEDDGISAAAPAAPTTRSAQKGTQMDMMSDNAQTSILDRPMAAGVAGGGDAARMMAEFERRMAAMETRIDELVDAKERLERQVAAQTEELRVQRAAIARTQRAVRNLSRPGEDAPTEPALRDPSRPEGPRS